MDWRIYYGDGTTVDSDSHAPEDVPRTDVIYILDRQPDNRIQDWRGTDYYVWEHGQWFGRDVTGYYQYMFRTGWKIALFGYHAPDAKYMPILIAAQNDPDFH